MHKLLIIQLLFVATFVSMDALAGAASKVKSSPFSSGSGSVLILEPYVGYERGYLTQNGIPEITTSGANYGARIGGRFMGIGMGLDYLVGSESSSQSGQTSDFLPKEYGLFVSYSMLPHFSLYGTYLLSAKAKVQSDVNSSDFSGTGYKVGIGWGLYSMLNINLELYNRTYTKYADSRISNSLLSSTAGLSLTSREFLYHFVS